MSWKKLPSVRRVKTIARGEWRCDWCGNKIPGKYTEQENNCSSLLIGPQYRANLDVGPCCNDKLVKSLRDAGMKFRLRPIREESK